MNKQEVYDYLKEKDIWHVIIEHDAVYNMDELSQIEVPHLGAYGKNLFVRDDKKRNYYLITVKEDKRVNLKEFKNKNNTRPLSFASINDLKNIMDLNPGSVTPFGLLNDKDPKVQFYIDQEFLNGDHIIGVHPNDNTATVWLKVEDLINVIEEHGNQVHVVDI